MCMHDFVRVLFVHCIGTYKCTQCIDTVCMSVSIYAACRVYVPSGRRECGEQ